LVGPAAIVLTGTDGARATLSAADIAALPRVSVTATIHGATHTFEGPPLTALLARIGAPSGDQLRGPALRHVVLVRARDGYMVALSLGETDAAFRTTGMVLADRIDGAPIEEADGPFRLIVEGDLRAARSVRMVDAIELRRLD
jgi:hypothetical protein